MRILDLITLAIKENFNVIVYENCKQLDIINFRIKRIELYIDIFYYKSTKEILVRSTNNEMISSANNEMISSKILNINDSSLINDLINYCKGKIDEAEHYKREHVNKPST